MKIKLPHRRKFGQDPSRDWYSSLVYFLVLLVVVILVDGYIYLHITSSSISVVALGDSGTTLSREDIQKVAQKIRTNESTEKTIPAVVLREPSL